MANNQQVFEAWLAGEISANACRQALAHDAQWLSRFETANSLQQLAGQPEYQPAPPIDTQTMFRQQWGRPPARQQQWWPKLSVAMSALAVLISISPLQLQVKSGSIALSWQQDNSESVQQQVALQLASYKTEQQQYLQQQLQLQQQQQTTQLVLLKDYLTENEQKNRRGDMLEMVEYLNQQRQADWQYWQDNFQPRQARLDYRPQYQPAVVPTTEHTTLN